MSQYDIFISYQWDIKPQVLALYRELTRTHNLSVWMDEFEMGPNSLYKELSTAIKNSKIFMCCVTRKYCMSNNCLKEINFASYLKKEFVVLMWEELKIQDIDEVGFIISPYVRNNCYKHPELLTSWTGDMFNSIMHGINQILGRSGEDLAANDTGAKHKKVFILNNIEFIK